MSRTNNTTTPVERVFESNKLELEERILVFLYGAIGFLALLSNMALCAVLLRNRQMLQRAYNIIIFALATVDTLTGLTVIVATVLVEVLGLQPRQDIHELLRGIQIGWFEFLFGEFSVFLIMVLTIERWFDVARPIQYRYNFRKSRVYVYIFTTIIATICINIHVLLRSYVPNSTQSKSFVVVDCVLTLIFPLVVTWATYIHLWQRFKSVLAIQQSNSTKVKEKLVRMCAITAMFLTLCWIPAEINLFVTTFDLTLKRPLITKICNAVAMINSIVNPWIYYFTNKEYKIAFNRLFNDILFPIQDMVKCCRSDSLRVTNAEGSKTKSSEVAVTVIPLTNFSLENESFHYKS